jgi:hypothetical protein
MPVPRPRRRFECRKSNPGPVQLVIRTYVRYHSEMRRTATDLRAHLYEALDHVASTGETIEINRNGVDLCIIRKPKVRAMRRVPKILPNLIVGNPDDLIHMEWPWSSGAGL